MQSKRLVRSPMSTVSRPPRHRGPEPSLSERELVTGLSLPPTEGDIRSGVPYGAPTDLQKVIFACFAADCPMRRRRTLGMPAA